MSRLAILCILTVLPSVALSADWTQWRGPTRDGRVESETPWPTSLDADHLQQAWRVPLGPSYSGPIVHGSRVFVTETRDKSQEVVKALDRNTGEELWQVAWQGAHSVPFFARSNGSWIRSTPTTDGERLYVAGIRDVLVCLDVVTGQEIWRVDFVKQFKSALPSFGTVCSPLIDGAHLYIQAAGSVIKLDKKTGTVVWRSPPASAGVFGSGMDSAFSSPIIETLAGQRQLIVQGRQALRGMSLETGQQLWSVEVPAFRGMNIQTPLVLGDSIFTSTYGGGSFLFDVKNSSDGLAVTQRWKTKEQGYMSSPVVIDNNVYLHLRNQRLTCLNPEAGKSNWTTRPFGKYWSMVVNGRQILALDQRGDLVLINANSEEFEKVASRHISDAETWAHLAVTGDQLFVRELNAMSMYSWK